MLASQIWRARTRSSVQFANRLREPRIRDAADTGISLLRSVVDLEAIHGRQRRLAAEKGYLARRDDVRNAFQSFPIKATGRAAQDATRARRLPFHFLIHRHQLVGTRCPQRTQRDAIQQRERAYLDAPNGARVLRVVERDAIFMGILFGHYSRVFNGAIGMPP